MIESMVVNAHIRRLYADGTRDPRDIEAKLADDEREAINYESRLLYITNETRAQKYSLGNGGGSAFPTLTTPAAEPRVPVPQPEAYIVVGNHGRLYRDTFKVRHFHALREIYGRNEAKQSAADAFIGEVGPALAGADGEDFAFPLMEKKLGRARADQLFDEFPGLTEQAGSLN